jgi:D-serine dehydratase
MDLDALLAEPLDGRFRAFPDTAGRVRLSDAGAQGWNVARGDLPFPVLTIDDGAIDHNLRTMHRWCGEQGVAIAPHGKTTMAPLLFRRQLAAGAWGLTAATGFQAAVMAAAGAPRIILANEVVGTAEAARVAALLRDGVAVYTLVDSVRGVELLDGALDAAGGGPLKVLLEIGAPGSRAGARDDETAHAVAEAVHRSRHLVLAGVEGWEGVLGKDRSDATLDAVDALCERAAALAAELDAAGRFEGSEQILLTAGGSSFFDRVALKLRASGLSRPCRTVLRSGCYLTHDHGLYDGLSPLSGELKPALMLWADVRSLPESGLAIVGFGKRDAPYDAGLPTVLSHPGFEVVATNDQHAFVRYEGDLAVGDVLRLGISHPCTAFDKWPALPLVDDQANVVGAVRTIF